MMQMHELVVLWVADTWQKKEEGWQLLRATVMACVRVIWMAWVKDVELVQELVLLLVQELVLLLDTQMAWEMGKQKESLTGLVLWLAYTRGSFAVVALGSLWVQDWVMMLAPLLAGWLEIALVMEWVAMLFLVKE